MAVTTMAPSCEALCSCSRKPGVVPLSPRRRLDRRWRPSPIVGRCVFLLMMPMMPTQLGQCRGMREMGQKLVPSEPSYFVGNSQHEATPDDLMVHSCAVLATSARARSDVAHLVMAGVNKAEYHPHACSWPSSCQRAAWMAAHAACLSPEAGLQLR